MTSKFAFLTRLCLIATVGLGAFTEAFGQKECNDLKFIGPDIVDDGTDEFGSAVAVDDDVAVVGAEMHDHDATRTGSAYVYRWDGTEWDYETELLSSDNSRYAQVGHSVAIDGNVIVLGAPTDPKEPDTGIEIGSAYIYRYNGTVWSQEAHLEPATTSDSMQFGRSVSISGNYVIIGAPYENSGATESVGAAYIYRYDGTTWTQQARLVASDGGAGDAFGWSVGIQGSTAVVGAPEHLNLALVGPGFAYPYRRSGTTWSQETKLLASDGAENDGFGWSTAIRGAVVLVGAPGTDDTGSSDHGSAYVFRYSAPSWSQTHLLAPADSTANDQFGTSVALEVSKAVIGAEQDNACSAPDDPGSAYVYKYTSTTWTQECELIASDGGEDDLFGNSVDISADVIWVGAPWNDDPSLGTNAGSAYVFSLCLDCRADVNGDGTVDPLDVGVVQSHLGCDTCAGDDVCDASDANGDCTVDVLDVGYIQARYGPCP